MRIALVGPELEENLSLRYIRGALEHAGHEAVQIDFNHPADLEKAAQELAQSSAQIAGLSMVFTARARQFVALAERARRLGFRGHVVAGGHFAAFNAEALLREVPAIDSVACGEGESIMCDLASYGGNPAGVPGLIWRDPTGVVTRNPPASLSPDLDRLPWPVRRFPPDDYLGLPVVSMLQSRGCEHACAFCSIAAWHRLRGGPRYRARYVEAVAAEMEALYAEGVRIFNFHDDTFLPRDRQRRLTRVQAFQHALSRRRMGRIAFAIKARPDEVDEEIFSLLISLGLFRVFLGVEAGTADSLQSLGRGQTEVARVIGEDLAHGEIPVQVPGLGHHRDAPLRILVGAAIAQGQFVHEALGRSPAMGPGQEMLLFQEPQIRLDVREHIPHAPVFVLECTNIHGHARPIKELLVFELQFARQLLTVVFLVAALHIYISFANLQLPAFLLFLFAINFLMWFTLKSHICRFNV